MSDSEEEFRRRPIRNYSHFEETSDNGESHNFSEDEDDYETDSDEEKKKEMVNIRKKLFKVKSNNGHIFNDKYFFPQEILSLILSYMEPKDLVFNCRRVCKNWCNIIDSEVWKLQLERNNFNVTKTHEFKWVYYYWILSKKHVFNRNLVKNNCGQEGLKYWESTHKDKSWKIEKPPVGCNNFPDDIDEEVLKHNSCFATRNDFKFGDADFELVGATSRFMDIVRPKITFTDWFCGRSDCPSSYSVDVRVIRRDYDITDSNRDPTFVGLIAMFHYNKKIGGKNNASWHKVSHVFENYKKGADCVLIEQDGKDSVYKKGCYGCKVTGTSVILSLP